MTFVSAVLSNSFKSRIASLFSMNLSRLFHCSVIKVLCLPLSFSGFYMLSQVSLLVNNFFNFLKLFFKLASFPRQLLDNTIEALHCQHFFTYFFTFSQVFLRKNRYCGIYIRKPQHLFSPYIFLIRKPVKIFDGTLL